MGALVQGATNHVPHLASACSASSLFALAASSSSPSSSLSSSVSTACLIRAFLRVKECKEIRTRTCRSQMPTRDNAGCRDAAPVAVHSLRSSSPRAMMGAVVLVVVPLLTSGCAFFSSHDRTCKCTESIWVVQLKAFLNILNLNTTSASWLTVMVSTPLGRGILEIVYMMCTR